MNREEQIYKHPSFGIIRFSRVNGQSKYLFGSEIQSDNFIELTISEGEMKRDMSKDWFSEGKEKIVVKMSQNQFAELITTMNYCPGVPCTIIKDQNGLVEQVEGLESKKTYTHNQFRQRMNDFMSEIDEKFDSAQQILKKSNITKKDREELLWFYQRISQEVKENIPFFAECFQEVMDKVIVDAKMEIDSAINHTIIEAGVKALGLSIGQLNVECKKE